MPNFKSLNAVNFEVKLARCIEVSSYSFKTKDILLNIEIKYTLHGIGGQNDNHLGCS